MKPNTSISKIFVAVLLCGVSCVSVFAQFRDCYLELVRLVARDPSATRGLELLVKVRQSAPGGDLQFDLGRFLEWYPEPQVATGVLVGLDHVKEAGGLDRFIAEMLIDDGKAASASVTLRYLRRNLAPVSGGAEGVIFELPIENRRLDFRLPNGDNVDTKALTWSRYRPFVIKEEFKDILAQSEVFINDAAARGAKFLLLFDTPMPPEFEAIFFEVFGNQAASVEFIYPG